MQLKYFHTKTVIPTVTTQNRYSSITNKAVLNVLVSEVVLRLY
jgi:hypothetical protein